MNENKIFSFMERVQNERLLKEEENAFMQTPNYKLKMLDRCSDEARNTCINKIFTGMYKDAIPLTDEYKNAHTEDIDKAFNDFIATRCPKGLEFYVKEGLKKKNPFAKKVLEAVDELINNDYNQKAMNIDDYNVNDLVFNTTDDVQKKLDVIGSNLSTDEIAQAVKDNVQSTVKSEITRAQKAKEELKNIEAELANDINVKSQESVEDALELRGYSRKPQDYNPSLFEAVFVSKIRKATPMFESGMIDETSDLRKELKLFGKTVTESGEYVPSVEDIAFVEAVKEYTGLSLLKALKFESFNKYELKENVFKYLYE